MNLSIQRSTVIGLLSAVVAGLMAGSALAAAPTATTNAATGVGVSAAALNGTIHTGGATTLWQFQYGTSKSYGKTTTANSIPAGGSLVIVSTAITGLKPSTTYHFRLVLQTGGKKSYPIVVTNGADKTFTTKALAKITLSTTTLKIKKGSTSVGVKCSSSVTCKGKLTLTARVKVGKKNQNITFGSKSFTIKSGKKSTLKFGITGKGLTALKHAHRHRLTVNLSTKFGTGQPKVNKKVTLSLP